MEKIVAHWVERSRYDLDTAKVIFLAELTPYHVEARYGDYKEKLSEIIDKNKAQEVYGKTLEIHKWLYQKTK
jgi:hypothetical protein